MKLNNILALSVIIASSSCSTMRNYTQVAQTLPVNEQTLQVADNGCYLYQDENCVITCDLWAEGGETNFRIDNISDEVITIYPDECTISVNGHSNMMFSKAELIVVAPHSYTTFSGVKLGYKRLVDCDFELCPQAGSPSTWAFSRETSPYVYNFYLTYAKCLSNQKFAAKMDFYLSRVSNYVQTDILARNQSRKIKTVYCKNVPGSSNSTTTEYYNQYLFSPSTGFFVTYSAESK